MLSFVTQASNLVTERQLKLRQVRARARESVGERASKIGVEPGSGTREERITLDAALS